MKEANQYSYCNVVGDTDVGCKRKANEDWYVHFECKNGLVSVVCDGMGGHVGGAVASHLSTETIQMFLENNYFEDPRTAIIEACNAANSAILKRTSQQPELTGMGSTCVMLIVRNGKVYIGSVGDSRIYLVRSKTITQLTKDQSYVQMLVDQGAITKEQAENHPRKNEITNALGLPSMQPATVLCDPVNPEAGDCFLLCSDGLSGMVSDHEIMKVASNQTGMTQRERVTELIQRARKNGGLDNITCLIVEFAVTPTSENDNDQRKRILLRYVLPCLIGALILGSGAYALWKHYHPTQKISEYVEQMSKGKNTRIITMPDTVYIAAGKPFVQIEENTLGTIVYITDYKGNKDTIPFRFKGFVCIVPDSIFTKSSPSDGRISYSFNGKQIFSPDVSLTFKDKDKDSTFVYVFPVKNPLQLGKKEELTKKEKKDNSSTELSTEVTKTKTEEETNYYEDIVTGTIEVDSAAETHTVVLKSTKGTPTNTLLFTDCAIELGNADNTWYSYKCSNRQECHIKILIKKMPSSNAQIKIPLKSDEHENFIINVHKTGKK